MISDQELKRKYEQLNLNKEDFQHIYKEFNENYSTECLKKLQDDDLVKRLFSDRNQTLPGLFNWLEFGNQKNIKRGFLGSATENKTKGIKIDNQTYSLYKYSGRSPANNKTLTQTEAINISKTLLAALEEIIKIVENIKPKNIEDYRNLSNQIELKLREQKYNQQVKDAGIWFWNNNGEIYSLLLKFLHCSKPEYFSCTYSGKATGKIINDLYGSYQNESAFVKNGLIALKAKEIGAKTANFEQLLVDMGLYNNKTATNMTNISNESKTMISEFDNKNFILYGPPGTGKTYSTVLHAVAICDSDESIETLQGKSYENDVIPKYKELKKSGRIEFVTFHQSYGYEEFVEGIKPILDNDNLLYTIEDGVFKRFCQTEYDDSQFERIWNKFIHDISKGNNKIKIKTQRTTRELEWDGINRKFNVVNYKQKGQYVNYEHVLDVYKGKFVDNKGSGTNQVKFSTAKGIIEHLKEKYQLSDYEIKEDISPKVFIIDEINRGNISKIFGELITLIEEGKRKGKVEELSCTLPYSKEVFSIPSNIYIIGTMNTADKSLTSIDTALRRRFKFIEMMPDTGLLDNEIEGINLSEMLQKMNERIEVLLDREHTIGHSYFMKIKKFEDLKETMNSEIIPLLQEYFFDNYENIRLVLADNQTNDVNKQFIVCKEYDNNLFGSDAPDFGDKKKYIIQKPDEKGAYIKIYDPNYLNTTEVNPNKNE